MGIPVLLYSSRVVVVVVSDDRERKYRKGVVGSVWPVNRSAVCFCFKFSTAPASSVGQRCRFECPHMSGSCRKSLFNSCIRGNSSMSSTSPVANEDRPSAVDHRRW